MTVGDEVVRDPARDVDGSVPVAVDGRPVRVSAGQRAVYAVHKPRGVVSTARDPQGRPTVVSLVPSARRLYPVGRLDAETTGLILLTDDGELAHRLTHPSFEVPRTYHAKVRRAAGARGGAHAGCARGSSSRTAAPLPRGSSAWPPTSSRSRSTRAASARCGECARPSAIR